MSPDNACGSSVSRRQSGVSANLDSFWLKDDALEESANLPEPHVIAEDITVDLETALENFGAIAEDMKK